MPETPAFYFDILENLAQGRCPACELMRRKPMHYIDHALYGLVVDPHAQNLFAETGGYCRRHAATLLEIPWGSALGVAILYNRLIEDASVALQAGRGIAAGRGKRTGLSLGLNRRREKPAADDRPDCLACRVERETEQGVLRTLVETLNRDDERMLKALEEREGFCLCHLDRALRLDPDDTTDAVLRRHGLRRAETLLAGLREFIRKNDYRFSREPMGAEGDSWMRAVAWVAGVSLEKDDRPFSPGELKRTMRGDQDAGDGNQQPPGA
jgi:hypothetical protein